MLSLIFWHVHNITMLDDNEVKLCKGNPNEQASDCSEYYFPTFSKDRDTPITNRAN